MANFWKKANAAKKRMIRGALVALVVYELVFGGAMWWVSREKLSDGGLLWLAVLPTLTVAAFILVLARYLKEEVDEFHRELVVRCLLWGTAAVMLMMAFHGFLQLFGWHGNWPVFVDLSAFLLAMLTAKLTYKVVNRPPVEEALPEGRA
jgi:hypothetical protein